MILGVHVSIAGKIYEAPTRAHELGCNTMQIFSRSPREWRKNALDKDDVLEFRQRCKKFKINPVFVHIPYLANLASPIRGLREDSVKAYIEDIKECENLAARYLVTHMGSHKDTSEKSGIKRFSKSLNVILNETKGIDVMILLENTSGSGSWLGYKFRHHKEILDRVIEPERIGLCLDTCHSYTAGYNIAIKEGLEETLDEIDEFAGLNRLKLIHLNDSKDKLNSRHDRHEHIARGLIGPAGMKLILKHPKLKKLPFILETPKKNENDDSINLAIVKGLIK